MKHICSLFILLLLVSACTGGDSRSHRLLQRADSLLDVQPDSALRVLQDVSPGQLSGKDELAYYGLLLVQAKYKNYLPLKGDTLSQELVSYYRKTGNRVLLARACYNLGCVYEDKGDPGKAFKAYYEAARLARREDDRRTLARVYNSLAYICLNQGMRERADSLYAELEHLARQTGDSVRLAEALLRRGGYALSLGPSAYPLAEQRIKSGYKLARGLNSEALTQLAYYNLGLLFDYTCQPEEALKVAQEFVTEAKDTVMLANAYLLLGNAYCRLKEYDWADSCLQRVMQTGNSMVKERACALLSHLAEQKGDYEQSSRWEKERKKYNQLKRAVFSHEIETVAAAKEVELAEALRSRDKKILVFRWGLVTLGLLWTSSIVIRWVNRRKKKYSSMSGEELSEALSPLETNVPNEAMPEGKSVKWEYGVFKKKMQDTEACQFLVSILSYYKQNAGYEHHWDVEQQKAFLQQVEVLLPGHQQALKEHFPGLTEKDRVACYLYLLGFSDEQVGILIERDRSTAYRRRKAMMLHKMGLERTDMDCLVQTCHL